MSGSETARDTRFMALALSLGRRGQGAVWPRPAVGCVLVREDRIVGRGWTEGQTGPHAEAAALARAGAAARGATAYVSLEPCAHQGTTPPCADALMAAGVARVVAAMVDPFDQVAGEGFARLRAAGVTVDVGPGADAAALDHAGFLGRVQTGRPFVTLKLATSLDGRIATASGESRWITGPAARRYVHGLRARHDAVLVGAGTARSDDPSLTVRGLGVTHQPVRVVASRHLDLPRDSALARSAGAVPLWICHGAGADAGRITYWADQGAKMLSVAQGADRQLSPAAILQALGAEGLTRVFCEGGGALAASLLGAGLVDQAIVMQAGLAIGAEGTPCLGAMGLGALSDAPRLNLVETRALGGDVLSRWERAPTE